MAKKWLRQIDFEVLAGMLVGIGWTMVKLDRFKNNNHALDIKMWCEEHIKNPYEINGATFVFEQQGDAVNFTLKWL